MVEGMGEPCAKAPPQCFAKLPKRHGGYEPGKGRESKHNRQTEVRQFLPDDESEGDEPDASERGAGCVDTGGGAAAFRAVQSGLLLFLLFMFFYERCGRRQDRGERQEEPADARTKTFCDHTRERRDRAAKKEAKKIFVPVRLTQAAGVDLYFHPANPRP